MKVELLGDWAKANRLISGLDRNIKEAAIKAQRKITERYVRLVKAHLRKQDIPGWTPLSPRYADFKMGKYGHEDILMSTHLMYDSITSWRSNDVYFAGIKRGEHYPSGVEIARVAEIHEAWSFVPGKPYRPLWSYTWQKDMGGQKGIRREFINEVKNRLRAKGYPVRDLRF